MEEPGGLQSMGSLRVGHDWVTSLSVFTFMHLRRKWQPLQCSCLQNPRDGRAWWTAIYGVTQSRTRLKRLICSSSISEKIFYSMKVLSSPVLLKTNQHYKVSRIDSKDYLFWMNRRQESVILPSGSNFWSRAEISTLKSLGQIQLPTCFCK